MIRILVTGSNGQLGSEIKKLSRDYTDSEFVFVDRETMPLENTNSIISLLNKINPQIIINAGAYTAVDKAEKDKELAEKVNHFAVDTISKWCVKNDAKLIHISTDYVFDGTSKVPYCESDCPAPINWYGETKLRGEMAIKNNEADAVIIRTSWVYSEYGNNFVKTMLRLMKERDHIGVVNDQIGTPTYALDLAQAIFSIIESDNWQSGIYHYSNDGEISWYDFAIAIAALSNLECQIKPVVSKDFPTVASRPNYSLLDKSKITVDYGLTIPDWKESLNKCLQILN